jgi:hypothetical protein
MNMPKRVVHCIALAVGLALSSSVSAQIPGLQAGTVTANVGGTPLTANVSLATDDEDGTLVLTNFGNAVQIQIPDARVGTFEIRLDEDGGLVGVILGLQVRNRMIAPTSGAITIESLDGESASGSFAFEGKDLETDAPVSVTDGRFQVRLVGGG